MKIRLMSDQTVDVQRGETIHAALKRAGIYLVASCGGKGTCGKCKVTVVEGRVRSLHRSRAPKGAASETTEVLACQTVPASNLLLDIPRRSQLIMGDRVAIGRRGLEALRVAVNPLVKRIFLEIPAPTLDDNSGDLDRLRKVLSGIGLGDMRFSHHFVSSLPQTVRRNDWKVGLVYVEGTRMPPEAIFLTDPSECRTRYGVAIDIGTTTIVVCLVDLVSGKVVETGSAYNSQIRYGDDVITRIIHAAEEEGISELRKAVVSDVNTILYSFRERYQIQDCEIEAVAVAGNTTMSHLFWGVDPSSIREEPYIPVVNSFPLWKAGTARLSVNSQSPVYTVPCVASYVGGDIVAGVLATKMHRADEVSLFMDIGTNGEIVIGNREWLITAACSAGPCFEGSGIRCGMRAVPGAIEKVYIDPRTLEPSLIVVGGGRPAGICGSGMIDAVSEMLLAGLIDQKGNLREGAVPAIRRGEEGLEYFLYRHAARGREIVLTEVDIQNILRAKAAIYAGVTTLLHETGLSPASIAKVYISGGFGSYLDIEKAIILGMLPDIPRERFLFMGNTSIMGAYLCLMSDDLRDEAEEIARTMTYMELSVIRRFMDEYLAALFLPHTDESQFPSVMPRLRR